MKKNLILLAAFMLGTTYFSYAQTSGNFTFTFSTIAPTTNNDYGTKHIMAVWIENSSPSFVKTKIKYANGDYDHLASWVGKSGSNTTDATTGATRSTYGTTYTIVWNGTDVAGAIVPDGTYKVRIEMAWGKSLVEGAGKTTTSFTFTKGSSVFQLAPTNTTFFSNISLNWAPSVSTSVEVKNDLLLSVYPNPTAKFVTLKFEKALPSCYIRIINLNGKEMHSELVKSNISEKTIDLGKFPDGVYLMTVKYDNKSILYRVVKKK